MSSTSNQDPRLDQAVVSDEALVAAHEKVLGKQPDEKGHYRPLPLLLVLIFSALILFSGTYLNRYAAAFDSHVFNENAQPSTGEVVVEKVDQLALGKKQYETVCVTCHQLTGLGVPGVFPPLAGSEWVTGSDERLIRIVLYGLKGPITVKGVTYAAAPMPAIGKVPGSGFNLTDEKIAAVLTYIRHEWGNGGKPISTEQVAAVHAKEGDRKDYVVEELMKLP